MITWQQMNDYQKHDLLKKKIDTYGDDALLCREEAMFYLRLTPDSFNRIRQFLSGIPNPKRIFYQLLDLKLYKEQSKIKKETIPWQPRINSYTNAKTRRIGGIASPSGGGEDLEAVLGLRMRS